MDPVNPGEPMRGFVCGEVIESRNPAFQAGEIVAGMHSWSDYFVTDGTSFSVFPELPGVDLSEAFGTLAIAGPTAHVGLLEVGQAKSGDTVVVSAAAGAVGMLVGQIARLKGCHTVGITGSEAKVRDCLETFGYDAAINYKKEDVAAALRAACPDGVDVYFDNTAGPVSDAVMERLRTFARIVVCGTMAIASAPPPQGPRYNRALLVARARMEGFMVFDHIGKLEAAAKELAQWAREGRIKVKEDWAEGLEAPVPHFLRLLAGDNAGKALVRLPE